MCILFATYQDDKLNLESEEVSSCGVAGLCRLTLGGFNFPLLFLFYCVDVTIGEQFTPSTPQGCDLQPAIPSMARTKTTYKVCLLDSLWSKILGWLIVRIEKDKFLP
jgi:hypothetical protein